VAPRLYLDWNATAPLLPEAREAALAALSAGGNASSVHAEGRAARAVVERARRTLAARFAVPPDAVVFTSGGTEANATALSPGVRRAGGDGVTRLVVSAVEHPAVLAGGRFHEVLTVPVDGQGRVDLDALERAVDGRTLVSVMAANNETGVLNPLDEVRAIVEAAGAVFHTDAVQAFGRVPDDALDAHLVTVSGHKIGAPAGVGALIRRGDVVVPPLIRGGGQERGCRAGTENVPAIAGFAAALKTGAADPAAWRVTAAARDQFEAALLDSLPGVTIFGRGAPRLPNTSLFSAGPASAALTIIALDLAGVAVSSGAACSSGKVAVSHVLLAMGVDPEVARRAVRVSAGPVGAEDALRRFLVALAGVIVPMSA
jgi:cysteine desulfurase